MVEPLQEGDIINIREYKQGKSLVEVSRIKELLKDVLNFAVVTNDKIELQCKIINTFSILFDNGNEDRGMRNDEEISCDTRNTNAGLKSLTKDGSVQPMTSRPDVHEASSQDSPAVPTQSPPSMTNKDKPSQVVVSESPSERVPKNPVGVSYPTPKEIILMGEKFIECSECGHNIIWKRTIKFCAGCGRKIKWEDKK